MLEVYGLSDKGRLRPGNEDSLVVQPERRLFAVADGMGGHAAGEVASRIAAQTIEALPLEPEAAADGLAESLAEGIRSANDAILADASGSRERSGMGTTLTVLVFERDLKRAVFGHVGDSRLYHIRAGKLQQITHDHTWVQQQVDAGALTAAQARAHPLSSVLTRALGTEATVLVDTGTLDCLPGDRFLLCSDGLTAMLVDQVIAEIASADAPAQTVVQQLIDAANERGGVDNITVVMVGVMDGSGKKRRATS
jgi:protein phosphatase